MLFIKKKKVVPEKKSYKKRTQHKKKKDYLLEDPSIKNEARSLWEAEDIYDEDDFDDN
jgi:hypothetical protein